MTRIETITTRIDREDDGRTITRLETRAEELQSYGRSGFELASTVTVPSTEWTIIIDTLTKTD